MLVILRSIDALGKYPIDNEGVLDEIKLARSFTLRTFQFAGSEAHEKKLQLLNDLR